MATSNEGGPAFPVVETEAGYESLSNHESAVYGNTHSTGGLSRRDWFAGQALQGILASGIYARGEFTSDSGPLVARECVKFGDAMVAALDVEK